MTDSENDSDAVGGTLGEASDKYSHVPTAAPVLDSAGITDAIDEMGDKYNISQEFASFLVAIMGGATMDKALAMSGLSAVSFQVETATNANAMLALQGTMRAIGFRAHLSRMQIAQSIVGQPKVSDGDKMAMQVLKEAAEMALPDIMGTYAKNARKKKAFEVQSSQERQTKAQRAKRLGVATGEAPPPLPEIIPVAAHQQAGEGVVLSFGDKKA